MNTILAIPNSINIKCTYILYIKEHININCNTNPNVQSKLYKSPSNFRVVILARSKEGLDRVYEHRPADTCVSTSMFNYSKKSECLCKDKHSEEYKFSNIHWQRLTLVSSIRLLITNQT